MLEMDSVNSTKLVESCPTDEIGDFDETVKEMVPLFFGLIGVSGLIGNSLVILVVLSNPQMRSTTNLLIINLASADLLFVVFCIPATMLDYISNEWPFGDTCCKIVNFTSLFN